MIDRLIKQSLARPLFVFLALALFVGAGIYAFANLPIEAFPDVTDTQATVIALYPGHAAEEVEQQVTVPLEIALSGMPHAVQIFSHTQQGLSSVVITFDDVPSDYFVRQQTLERLSNANLPPSMQPTLGPLTTAIGEVYRFRVTGDGY
ncbi:MAG TPA: efflux RND transporter permease subunit, partial [Steroidobacteraceae bacterium]|nr:efflux RND transporter permease subunit [Steroidobacteraceae bacterium]